MMAFTKTTPAAPKPAVWLGSHSVPRTKQLAPLLCLTSKEAVSEGPFTTNHQKKITCAIGKGTIFKDNSKTHIISNSW